MNMTKYLTPEGFVKLKKELKEHLDLRSVIAKRIEEAKALGDLSENADYSKAKEEQAFNEGKVREIEGLLSSAELIKEKNGDSIGINSTIKVRETSGKDHTYQIVGAGESDPLAGKISYEAPLGEQFFGKKAGEVVEITTPAGKKVFKIVSIN
jgi:transcription elongation factor GreA